MPKTVVNGRAGVQVLLCAYLRAVSEMRAIAHLFLKDLLLELRQKYAIGGILLYVASTVFLVFYAVGTRVGQSTQLTTGMGPLKKTVSDVPATASVWAAFFWVIVLFAAVNAIAKSFVAEHGNRRLYYFTLASPTAFVLAKMLYSAALMTVLSVLSFAVYGVVMANPVQEVGLFYLALLLGGIGLAFAFTFVSAIAAKADNSATLMAVLGFPVVLPILLTLVRLSKYALHLNMDRGYVSDLLILVCIDVLLAASAVVLFPYLWKE